MKNFGNKDCEIEKAVAFIDRIGVNIDTRSRHNVTISVSDANETLEFVNPLFVKMTTDNLIDLSIRIRSLGFCGKRVIKALLLAISNLEDEEINDILNNFYIRSYKPKDIVEHFFDTFATYCEKANVRISKSTIDKRTTRNVWFSFGRTLGLTRVFLTILKHEVNYFRDCRRAEEALGVAPIIEIQNPSVDKCSTCKNCKIDRKTGLKECKASFIDVPKHFHTSDIEELYPSVIMDGGVLRSKYVIHHVDNCESYKSRICAVMKHNVNTVDDINLSYNI